MGHALLISSVVPLNKQIIIIKTIRCSLFVASVLLNFSPIRYDITVFRVDGRPV